MKKILLFLLVTTFIFSAFTQGFNEDDSIPVDSSIIKGVLDNGLTYYVKHNVMPENRVEMRLVLKAGSILEDDDQQGLAHFLEHMCFNGTKNFKKQELVDFLEETGVKFGPDLNAYTSFDETVYYFLIPSERPSLLDTGLMVLYDWAHNVTLEDEEVDKERGVVIEEWRLGLGAEDRMFKEYVPVILKDSKYEKRLPIGKKDIIESFDYNTLSRFYQDWYRPELMAVIVVGDVNKKEMEQKIIKQFSKLPVHNNPRKREYFSIPNNSDPLIAVSKDKEASYIEVDIFYKHDKKPEGKVGVYKENLEHFLFNGIMRNRIQEIIQTPESPFINAATQYSSYIVRAKDAYMSLALAKENKIKESLENLLLENQRIKQHGITESELERQKKEVIAFYESALKEKGKTHTKSYGAEFTRNFLTDEPIPGIDKEFEYVQHFLPQITVNDINELAKKWIIDTNIVVVITGPEKEGLEYPTEKEIIDIINQTMKSDVNAYIDEIDNSPLIDKLPKKGRIKSEKYNKENDYYELVLSNGAKVIVKQTEFKNDEILFNAISYGGESMYGIKDMFSAKYADVLTQSGGVGNFNNVALTKKLAGSTAGVSYSIDQYTESITGSSSPKDIEDLFKLNYLYFTSPRKDSTSFNAYISRLENSIKYLESDPSSVFGDTVTKIINSNNPRYISILKKEHIDQINLERTYDIFNERFSNPADFLFLFVGNISMDILKNNIEKYLASVPSSKEKEKWNDIEADFPEDKTNFYFYKGIDPQAKVYLFMEDTMTWNNKERLYMNFLNKAISIRLREKIREDQGGTYGVRVRLNMTDIPEPKYSWTIGFGCDPNKTDTLYNIAFNELNSMKESGPTEEEMIKVKEIFIRDRETAIKTNEYWLSVLKSHILKNDPIIGYVDYQKIVSDITKEDIISVAKKYINLENYVHAVLLPENMNP